MTTVNPTPTATDAECCATIVGAPLDDEEARVLAAGFAALADPVRLRLLSIVADRGEVCSCDLQGPLGKSQPTISHHTKALAAAGLIEGERRGRWVHWRLVPERLEALRRALASDTLTLVDVLATVDASNVANR